MCDLVFVAESMDIENYADDTTPYAYCEDFGLIINKLEVKANKILQWFIKNVTKVNADNCHLLVTNNEEKNIFIGGETIKNIFIGGETIKNNEKENLLRITIDNKLFYWSCKQNLR